MQRRKFVARDGLGRMKMDLKCVFDEDGERE